MADTQYKMNKGINVTVLFFSAGELQEFQAELSNGCCLVGANLCLF